MSNNGNGKITFGDFKLDTAKRIVWHRDEPVDLPLKAVDLLCLLVERRGDVVTKDEIWRDVWHDAIVEETNLTHNIYLLRKTFRELGADELIKTVPRRGYRFVGEVSSTDINKVVYERATVTETFIEEVTPPYEKRHWKTGAGKFAIAAGAVFLVALTLGFVAYRGQISPFGARSETIRSIAVLPFEQLSEETEANREGVVLADILINRLSTLRTIRVSSITAVADLDPRDPIAAGKTLDVEAVLVGTIYRLGDKTRVSARILNVTDGKAIWAGDLERFAADDMRMHNDLATQVTNALALHLDPEQRAALAKSFTADHDAFRLYQEARFEWNKRNAQGAIDAASLFRQAIKKDPQFALAYAGLAEVVATMNPNEAEVAAEKAIELDPDLSEAYAALGFIHTFVHRDWAEAEKKLTRSIELNPNNARAHHWHAELLAILGRNPEAKTAMHRALAIDPRSHNFLADLGQIYYFNGEYTEAESYCRRALEIAPDFAFAHEYLADIYLQTGEFEKAVDSWHTAMQIQARLSLDTADRRDQRETSIEERRTSALQHGRTAFLKGLLSGSKDPVMTYYDARRYASLGDKEMALLSLERAIESKAFQTAFIKAEPVFAALRDEPRFVQVLRAMKLSN